MTQTLQTKEISRLLYLICLLVLTVCNLLISLFLIPFLLIIQDFFIYVIIASLGLIFGGFFALIIWDIQHLEKKHHIMGVLFIPLFAIINFFIIIKFAKGIGDYLALPLTGNTILISLSYIVPFLIPYFYTLLRKD